MAIASRSARLEKVPCVIYSGAVPVVVVPIEGEEIYAVFDGPLDMPVGHLGLAVAIVAEQRPWKAGPFEGHPAHGVEVAGEVVATDDELAGTRLRLGNVISRWSHCQESDQDGFR